MAWTTAFINDLPDASFLFIEDGGAKDEGGNPEAIEDVLFTSFVMQ